MTDALNDSCRWLETWRTNNGPRSSSMTRGVEPGLVSSSLFHPSHAFRINRMEETTSSDAIRIFARIRPCREKGGSSQLRKNYRLDQAEPTEEQEPQLHFCLPKNETQGLINNSRENYDFRFHRVFDQATSQEEVFDVVAKEVVDRWVT